MPVHRRVIGHQQTPKPELERVEHHECSQHQHQQLFDQFTGKKMMLSDPDELENLQQVLENMPTIGQQSS